MKKNIQIFVNGNYVATTDKYKTLTAAQWGYRAENGLTTPGECTVTAKFVTAPAMTKFVSELVAVY